LGRTGRGRSAAIAAHLAAVLLLLATACGGNSPAISELLLGPADFPDHRVTVTSIDTGETAEGQPTAITELSAPSFSIVHSLVIFDTQEPARTALAGVGVQWEQLAGGQAGTTLYREDLAPLAIAGQELVTGVLEEVRAGTVTSSVIFVQGSVLVRLTISSTTGQELLLSYAEIARVKAARQ
jgi:hypothetical protein